MVDSQDRAAMSSPLLSILIPAYRYPEGVGRILAQLTSIPLGQVELIVFDDSPDDETDRLVARWADVYCVPLVYKRNRPSNGAVKNWNALLDAARGAFCWLLHHDEFPVGDGFIDRLLQALVARDGIDVIIMDCILFRQASAGCRRHQPASLRRAVIKRWPNYLLRRNVIGPVSSLVVKRDRFPKFDENLHWLVDVDMYVRLLRCPGLCLSFREDLQVVSVIGRADSITSRMRARISRVETEELAYLCQHRDAGSWLSRNRSSVAQVLLRCVEMVGWGVMCAIVRGVALVAPAPVSVESLKKYIYSCRQLNSSTVA